MENLMHLSGTTETSEHEKLISIRNAFNIIHSLATPALTDENISYLHIIELQLIEFHEAGGTPIEKPRKRSVRSKVCSYWF